MADVLKKFGRYFLLDHLAQGGMAEIYRARLASRDGAGRLMVIKRIQASFGANADFLQMFKTETKVTMGLNHPNIVQLYDFGEENHQPYIVMEWVDGKNLRQLMSRFAEMKQTFPVELAAYIMEQAAGGLHYAHSARDKITGQTLNIVHRDISPQNLLVSFEGTIKIIDFGIAKAASQSENTRAGVIKGKPSYLAPEQISGEVLDGRCDLFALGTVLWELLTGRKLFAGENDLAVLKMIESAQTHVKPPSTLNPKVPKELDYIVLRALAKQREKRFQTGEEMSRALHKFLYSYMPEFNPQDLGYYAKDLFKEDIVEDRKHIQRLNDKVEQLLAEDIPELTRSPSSDVAAATAREREETTTIVDAGPKRGTGAREFDQPLGVQRGSGVEIERRAVNRGTAPAVRPGTQAPAAEPAKRTTRATSQGAERSSPASSSGIRSLLLAAALIGAVILAPEAGFRIPVVSDYIAQWTGVGVRRDVASQNPPVESSDISAQAEVSQVHAPEGRKKILLRLSIGPGCGGTVTINNQVLRRQAIEVMGLKGEILGTVEGHLAEVPLDEPLELKVERPGFGPIQKEFTLTSADYGTQTQVDRIESLVPIFWGKLTLSSQPSADHVIFTSERERCSWLSSVPLINEMYPPGEYRVKLVNTLLHADTTESLKVEKGGSTSRQIQMQFRNLASP